MDSHNPKTRDFEFDPGEKPRRSLTEIMNTIIYSEDYIDNLYNSFNGKLFRSRDDVLRFITHSYVDKENMPKRTFSKLTMDIHKEFGLNY